MGSSVDALRLSVRCSQKPTLSCRGGWASRGLLGIRFLKLHRLQFGKHGSDKYLGFDAQYHSIGIIGNPNRGAPKFSMR
jgi:hypothetical protein